MTPTTPTAQTSGELAIIARGHWLLLGCVVLYLVWWWLFFRPGATRPAGSLYAFGAGCLVVAAVLGVSAAVLVGPATGRLAGMVPGMWINVGGILGYVVLLWLTSLVFHRQPTTELILFVGWATLELDVINALVGSGSVGGVAAVALLVLVIVMFVVSLVCYVLYYGLEPWPSFVCGCIPLVSVGVAVAVFALVAGAAGVAV